MANEPELFQIPDFLPNGVVNLGNATYDDFQLCWISDQKPMDSTRINIITLKEPNSISVKSSHVKKILNRKEQLQNLWSKMRLCLTASSYSGASRNDLARRDQTHQKLRWYCGFYDIGFGGNLYDINNTPVKAILEKINSL